MRNTISLTSLFAISLFLVASHAQAATNYSGEWKMDAAKSDFGPQPAPEMLVRTIKHNDPVIEISTHQKGAAGETTSQLKYTTDGKESTNKLPNGEAKGTAKWEGNNLVIDSTREFQGMNLILRETWVLSGGGKVLTITNHISIAGQGEFDQKLVLDKQ